MSCTASKNTRDLSRDFTQICSKAFIYYVEGTCLSKAPTLIIIDNSKLVLDKYYRVMAICLLLSYHLDMDCISVELCPVSNGQIVSLSGRLFLLVILCKQKT